MVRKALLTAVLTVGFAAPVTGQVQVGLSPMVGGYVPIGDLFDQLPLGTGGTGPFLANVGQEPGLLIGGRLALRLSRITFEAELGYALSNVDLPQAVVDAGLDNNASVFLGSLNVLYELFQAPLSPLSLYASAGAGVISRNGDFFDRFEGTTALAGALGFGLRFGLSPLMHLRFDLRDYISSFGPRVRTFEFDSRIQNDLILAAALEFALTPTSGR